MKRLTWFALGWLVLPTMAQAASFDCAKANTKIEKLICGDAGLSKLDDELGEAYKHAIDQQDDKDRIVKEQKHWLKETLKLCQDTNCLKSAYRRRIGELTKMPNTTFRDCPDCPEMVVVPSGSFDLSLTNSVAVLEVVSTSRVKIERFAIGKTEVTQGQWRAIMGNDPDKFTDCGDNCPVRRVSWFEAKEYIKRLNAKTGKHYRLPSDAEWEYACLAGRKTKYCGSDSVESVAWYGNNSGMTDHLVATKQPNAFGLYDMSGNVSEWVEDCTEDKYYGGCDSLPASRGGGWNGDESTVRAVSGYPAQRGLGTNQDGFRVAITLP